MKLVGTTVIGAVALLGALACSASGGQPQQTGSGGTGGVDLGCTNTPDCFSECVCKTNNADACVEACRNQNQNSTGGSGGTGTGGSGGAGCVVTDCISQCMCQTQDAAGCVQACSGTGGTGAGGSGVGGSGGSVGGSGGIGTGGVGGTGSGGTGGTARTIVTLKLLPFTVAAGQEVFACQSFANPAASGALVFVETASYMTLGSHHMFVMEDTANTNSTTLETHIPGVTNNPNCNGLNFAPMIHSAQEPTTEMIYPPGVGAKLSAGTGIRVLAHYLNTSTQPLTPDVRVELHIANPGEVTQMAGFLFGNVATINVRAGSTGSASGSCTIPYQIGLLNFVSHMHRHATNFVATVGGQQLYQTTEWDAPKPVIFNPPRNLAANSVINWTCNYDNTTGSTALTFGESAATNEMCIITGRAITPNGDPLTCKLF
jgi:hypothetical protein